jgi:hypothetical protein
LYHLVFLNSFEFGCAVGDTAAGIGFASGTADERIARRLPAAFGKLFFFLAFPLAFTG